MLLSRTLATKAKAWSQRSTIWRDASSAPTRAPTALVMPSFVGAMRGVAESYYRARRLSYNHLKRSSYNAFNATVPDFDIPAPTHYERLRLPSQLPRGATTVAHSELAARPPSSSSAADRRLPNAPTHTQFRHAPPSQIAIDGEPRSLGRYCKLYTTSHIATQEKKKRKAACLEFNFTVLSSCDTDYATHMYLSKLRPLHSI
jgi:hypothetical protein